MIDPQAQKAGIRVSFASFDSPCFVEADRTRLKQVIVNLLSNADQIQPHGWLRRGELQQAHRGAYPYQRGGYRAGFVRA